MAQGLTVETYIKKGFVIPDFEENFTFAVPDAAFLFVQYQGQDKTPAQKVEEEFSKSSVYDGNRPARAELVFRDVTKSGDIFDANFSLVTADEWRELQQQPMKDFRADTIKALQQMGGIEDMKNVDAIKLQHPFQPSRMREIYFRYQLSSLGGPTNTWLPEQKKTLERLVADYSKNEPNVIDLDRDYSLVYREGDLLGAVWDGRVYMNNIPEEERPKYYLEEGLFQTGYA